MNSFPRFASLCLVPASLLLPVSAVAQTATLHGQVTDPSGAVIPGASISLTGGARPAQTQSGADGAYSIRASCARLLHRLRRGHRLRPAHHSKCHSHRRPVQISQSRRSPSRFKNSKSRSKAKRSPSASAPTRMPAPLSSRAARSMRSPTIRQNCKMNCRRSPVPLPAPMAAKSTLTALKAARFRPNPTSSKSASIKIPSPLNTIASATAASRSSPSPARKNFTAAIGSLGHRLRSRHRQSLPPRPAQLLAGRQLGRNRRPHLQNRFLAIQRQ